jgi:hypothetical protein
MTTSISRCVCILATVLLSTPSQILVFIYLSWWASLSGILIIISWSAYPILKVFISLFFRECRIMGFPVMAPKRQLILILNWLWEHFLRIWIGMLLSFLRGDQQVEVRTQLKSFRAVSFELFFVLKLIGQACCYYWEIILTPDIWICYVASSLTVILRQHFFPVFLFIWMMYPGPNSSSTKSWKIMHQQPYKSTVL